MPSAYLMPSIHMPSASECPSVSIPSALESLQFYYSFGLCFTNILPCRQPFGTMTDGTLPSVSLLFISDILSLSCIIGFIILAYHEFSLSFSPKKKKKKKKKKKNFPFPVLNIAITTTELKICPKVVSKW